MIIHKKLRVVRIDHLVCFVGFLESAVQPRADQKLLCPFRIRSTLMLATNITINGTNRHKIIPTPNREAGHIHFRKMFGAIFIRPIGIICRMFEPFFKQLHVIFGVSRNRVHCFESGGPGSATNSVTFMKKAKASIDHILANKMRRLRNSEKILCKTSLGTTKRSDFTSTKRLLC